MATPTQLEQLLETWFAVTDLFGRPRYHQGQDVRQLLVSYRAADYNPTVDDMAGELLALARQQGVRLGRFLGTPEGEVFLQVASTMLPVHEAYLAGLIAEALVKAARLEQAGRRRDATPLLVGAGVGAALLAWGALGSSS
jgi:hypothetical protein